MPARSPLALLGPQRHLGRMALVCARQGPVSGTASISGLPSSGCSLKPRTVVSHKAAQKGGGDAPPGSLHLLGAGSQGIHVQVSCPSEGQVTATLKGRFPTELGLGKPRRLSPSAMSRPCPPALSCLSGCHVLSLAPEITPPPQRPPAPICSSQALHSREPH